MLGQGGFPAVSASDTPFLVNGFVRPCRNGMSSLKRARPEIFNANCRLGNGNANIERVSATASEMRGTDNRDPSLVPKSTSKFYTAHMVITKMALDLLKGRLLRRS